jgi:hypothetical protein
MSTEMSSEIRLPEDDGYPVGEYYGEYGFGNIKLRDIYNAYNCSHELCSEHKIKDHIGISISEMIIRRDNNNVSFNPSQHIDQKKVFYCMWDLYIKLARNGLKKVNPYDDEIDLFGTFVCIYLKKKFPKLDSICWVRKIKEDFPKYIENKK